MVLLSTEPESGVLIYPRNSISEQGPIRQTPFKQGRNRYRPKLKAHTLDLHACAVPPWEALVTDAMEGLSNGNCWDKVAAVLEHL